MTGHATNNRQRGFALIESLAALTILALGLIILFSGFSGGVKSELRADFFNAAARIGSSKLARLGVAEALENGVTSGRSNEGLDWSLSVRPYGLDGRDAPRGYWAEITIRQSNAGVLPLSLTLTSLKLAPPLPAQR